MRLGAIFKVWSYCFYILKLILVASSRSHDANHQPHVRPLP